MPAICLKKNPLTRNGTNQWDRFLKSLNPDSVKVDGRSTADMVMFAKRLSEEIKFYHKDNTEDNRHWAPFFSQNLTAILAQCETLPVHSFRRFSQDLRAFLSADPKRSITQLRNHFQLLFYLPVVLLHETGKIYQALPRDHALGSFIERVLVRDIEIPLRDLISFYKGALSGQGKVFTDGPVKAHNYNVTFDDQDSRIQLSSVVTERILPSVKLSELSIDAEFLEGIHSGGWASLYAEVDSDANPYRTNVGKVYDQIYDALNSNLVTKAFDRLFQALERVSRESGQYLNESLTSFDQHPPHYALWLTFLRLFNVSQQHLNTLTKRHLDYYYSDILQLALRKGEPHKVHVLFEPNKNIASHLLVAEDTLFKGGKDDSGQEVSYQLDEDMVVNQAKVVSLKSLYRPSLPLDGARLLHPFAASVTNSQDGSGEPLVKDHLQWKPFGPLAGQADARIGFAVADKQLFLREGHRTIELKVQFDSNLPLTAFSSVFKASLTTEEGWFDVDAVLDPNDPDAAMLHVTVESTTEVYFRVTLNGEDPPIIPYDPAIHQEGFSVASPVLKVEFSFAQPHASEVFTALGGLGIQSIELGVQVSGVRQMTLQNEFGQVDTSKPFLPFGPTPQKNSLLTLGSSEVFSKKLRDLTFHVEWETEFDANKFFPSRRSARTDVGLHVFSKTKDSPSRSGRESRLANVFSGSSSPPAPSAYTVEYHHLKNGTWERPRGAKEQGLFEKDWSISKTHLDEFSDSISQTLENEPYSNSSSTGFLRLELQKDFGHKEYPGEYTVALIDLANDGTSTSLPLVPYTPKMKGLTLDYVTQATSPAKFFHLHPFGFQEIADGPGQLFSEVPHEGALYIGVQDLEPPQRLSLLFQAVDGSANPLKPENTLEWAYLQDNHWENFKGQEVDDKTHNLTGSGIIGLAVPEEANTIHTLLPSGLHWFRMAVKEHADALNDLLSIDAQAAAVTFRSQNNDPQFLSRTLEPGTISKLKVSQNAIKKISQPYPSFGGKAEETREHFYVRVSERLRHKDRASTMWDYEHLVLEHFTNVYKVKCINHTELCRDLHQQVIADNELKPGHVLVVPIPFVLPGTAINPLRPFMDKKTMTAIDRFLRTRISPFIQLEVQNPKIEEVQIQCHVAFTDKIADKAFYKEELEQAIIRYLTPWAYDEGVEISFGGRWHKSAIINFVEEQDYVDFVKDFEMYHKVDIERPDHFWSKVDQEVVEATTARSILVSHGEHVIHDI